jgi:hypothetical protein
MMLRHPIARIARILGGFGEAGGIGERAADIMAFADGDEIEHGELYHAYKLSGPTPAFKG